MNAYRRFVAQNRAWVEAAIIRPENVVLYLENRLSGRAHDFYMREISDDPRAWTLNQFFEQLYNECFGIDALL